MHSAASAWPADVDGPPALGAVRFLGHRNDFVGFVWVTDTKRTSLLNAPTSSTIY